MAHRLMLACGLAALVCAEPGLAAPSPNLGRTAVVNKVSGTVLVKDRGEGRFHRLSRSPTRVRMGAILNATRGKVRIRTAAGPGRPLNNGVFSLGTFAISQGRRAGAVTELKLRGGTFRGCATRAGAKSGRATRLVRRRLRGSARGRFRTRGRYSAATVRGTTWLMEDRCDGTRTAAEQGSVRTDSDGELTFDLAAGDIAQYFCDYDGQGTISRAFCTVMLNRPAEGLWGGAIVNLGPAPDYDLCISDPTGEVRCGTFPFSEPDSHGIRQSAVVCTTHAGPGAYSLRWFVSGVQLGPALGFTGTQPPTEQLCISDP
jgi:hypothetical protein